jgi:uncharacterized SAM-binding protein YcdF (DUF218 family)
MLEIPLSDDIKSPGLLLGTGILMVYLYVKKRDARFAQVILIFLASVTIIGGLHLSFLAYNKLECIELEQSRIYVFLGGLAVTWTSINTIANQFKPALK